MKKGKYLNFSYKQNKWVKRVLSMLVLVLFFSVNSLYGLKIKADDVFKDISQGDLTITDNGTYTVSGTTTRYVITVNNGCSPTIILNNVNIDVSSTSYKGAISSGNNCNVTIILKEDSTNTLKSGSNCAGIQKGTGTLTINGSGVLDVTGGFQGAGIGGGNDGTGENITINGGTITATGDNYGAGIGGGCHGSGENITISGGTVQATGGKFGAGIGGGGYAGTGEIITITGGTITATGGNYAAGIGGGYQGSGENITITGGTITATGGNCAAGIGGGDQGSGENITITGGTITATGGNCAAGIGGGYSGGKGKNITISGGTVQATGGKFGAGIGGGYYSAGKNITITGGTITATGGNDGAGIGGGGVNTGENITISGGTTVTTSINGNGIGGGRFCTENNNNIVINGGSVNAQSERASKIGTQPKNGNDNGNINVYLVTVTVYSLPEGATPNPVVANTHITDLATDIASYYGYNDVYTDENGKVYLYLPTTNNTIIDASDDSGTEYEGNGKVKSNNKSEINLYPAGKKVGNILLTKEGIEEPNQSSIFEIKKDNNIVLTIAIKGNGSETIKDLPTGGYTITEKNWSWRYTPDATYKNVTVKKDETTEVKFVNQKNNYSWLSGESFCNNIFNSLQ